MERAIKLVWEQGNTCEEECTSVHTVAVAADTVPLATTPHLQSHMPASSSMTAISKSSSLPCRRLEARVTRRSAEAAAAAAAAVAGALPAALAAATAAAVSGVAEAVAAAAAELGPATSSMPTAGTAASAAGMADRWALAPLIRH